MIEMASSSATRYPYLLGNSSYDNSTDFTLNTPEIVDMLDFDPPFQNEKDFTADNIFSEVYGIIEGPMSCGSNSQSFNGQSPTNNSCLNNFTSHPYADSPMIGGVSINNMNNYYDRKLNSYSPLLESAEINLENMSSPEMAPVSPNKVCPQSEYSYQFDNSNSVNNSNNAYQMLESAVPIKTEYEQVSVDFLNDQSQQSITMVATPVSNTTTLISNTNCNNYYKNSPHSPASISSNYSMDSSSSQQKTFTTLDNVQCTIIKQEPMDSIVQYHSVVPTVVDETIVSTTFVPTSNTCSSTGQQQLVYNITPNTNNNNNNSYYYMSTTTPQQQSIVPTSSITPNKIQTTTTNINTTVINNSSTTNNNGSRKRAATNFGMSNGTTTTTNGQKKQRMSKREKQKMMESYIEKYERENKQLISQIESFEKQISFCKKYLSENVAPYIQRQQQQQQPINKSLQSFIGLA